MYVCNSPYHLRKDMKSLHLSPPVQLFLSSFLSLYHYNRQPHAARHRFRAQKSHHKTSASPLFRLLSVVSIDLFSAETTPLPFPVPLRFLSAYPSSHFEKLQCSLPDTVFLPDHISPDHPLVRGDSKPDAIAVDTVHTIDQQFDS